MTPGAADPTIRRQVMSAAVTILDHDPGAPIGQIARAAGVSRATFYRHFGSRSSLLSSIAHEPRPDARTRILAAAQEMLVRDSLAALSMDDLARAAGVSRGTLYRLVPGKPALFRGLIETYAPFDAIRRIVGDHHEDPPELVLPLIAAEIVGIAGQRLGLMRAIFHEATLGFDSAIEGARPMFAGTIGVLADYLAGQMARGRVRRMHPVLALQAFIGPIFFHLMTRPVIDEVVALPKDPARAIDDLVVVTLAGLRG
ncbi:MAG TPA: TetR/AcrR family transcriptional regulator [Candidatus Limnocylindrales bacterium]|jgi:AcrR family transcriptional regulator